MARTSGCRMVDAATLQPSVHLLATILFNIVLSDSSNHRLMKDSNQRLHQVAFHDTTRRNPESQWDTTNLCKPGPAAVRNRNSDVRPMATVLTHTVLPQRSFMSFILILQVPVAVDNHIYIYILFAQNCNNTYSRTRL